MIDGPSLAATGRQWPAPGQVHRAEAGAPARLRVDAPAPGGKPVTLHAGLVLVVTGVRPETSLAVSAGAAIYSHLTVDQVSDLDLSYTPPRLSLGRGPGRRPGLDPPRQHRLTSQSGGASTADIRAITPGSTR